MSRRGGKDSQPAAEHAEQDGGRSQRSAKKAAIKLFSKMLGKDIPSKAASLLLEPTEKVSLHEGPEPLWPEDPDAAPLWDTVSTPAPAGAVSDTEGSDLLAPEPTLRDIFAAVTSCSTSITALTSEIKGVKLELKLVRQDMLKLRDRNAALEDRMSNVEDEVVPLQREIRLMQSITSGHEALLEDMENRQRRNNVCAVGIPEKTEGNNPLAFMENWLLY